MGKLFKEMEIQHTISELERNNSAKVLHDAKYLSLVMSQWDIEFPDDTSINLSKHCPDLFNRLQEAIDQREAKDKERLAQKCDMRSHPMNARFKSHWNAMERIAEKVSQFHEEKAMSPPIDIRGMCKVLRNGMKSELSLVERGLVEVKGACPVVLDILLERQVREMLLKLHSDPLKHILEACNLYSLTQSYTDHEYAVSFCKDQVDLLRDAIEALLEWRYCALEGAEYGASIERSICSSGRRGPRIR